MLHWLAYAAFLVTLCTALPSPSPQPQPQSQSRAPQGPVRAEVGAILATFDPNSDQRDYIFIFNGYNSADRLIRQTGCYHNMQPYGPDILCLDANAYDGGIIEADPSRGKRAFESVRRFRDFLLSGEDNGAPGYRTPQFQLRSMQPTILAQKNGGLEFDFRVELLNNAHSKTIHVLSDEWTQTQDQARGTTEYLWNPEDQDARNIELHPWFRNRQGR